MARVWFKHLFFRKTLSISAPHIYLYARRRRPYAHEYAIFISCGHDERAISWHEKIYHFYIVGGVLTQILSFIYIYFAFENEKFINLVGASGALCMLFGMLATSVLYSDKKTWFGYFAIVVAMSFLPLLMGINVAWYAHFIGWGIGCLYAKFYLKRADEIF